MLRLNSRSEGRRRICGVSERCFISPWRRNNWSFPHLLSSPPLGSAVRQPKPTVKLKLAAINQVIADGLLGLRQIDHINARAYSDLRLIAPVFARSVWTYSMGPQIIRARTSGLSEWLQSTWRWQMEPSPNPSIFRKTNQISLYCFTTASPFVTTQKEAVRHRIPKPIETASCWSLASDISELQSEWCSCCVRFVCNDPVRTEVNCMHY